jgi:hypothetical protein
VTGSPPASAALVTALRWKSETRGLHSTVVGKITMQLRDDGRAALVAPDPFVSFDLLSPETQRVLEASELMPWTAVCSFVAYGGPLRFTLSRAGQTQLTVALGAEAPAGITMASEERVRHARSLPSRGLDGVLTIPDDIDGRYFVCAPASQQFASLAGDETFTLELAGFSVRRALPGLAVVVLVEIGGKRRPVALTPDFISVNARERRLSLVSRAVVQGEATVLRHSLLPVASLGAADHGDAAPALTQPRTRSVFDDPPSVTTLLDVRALEQMSLGEGDETSDVSAEELAALAAPYALEAPTPAALGGRTASLPATPFDPGFVPVPVVPGAGVLATLTPDEEMARQLDEMRRALREEGGGASDARLPVATNAEKKAVEPPQTARVAPPKPGAMAKPRFKRR